jgi:hypothetical protein
MRTTYTSDKILNLYRGTTFTAPATVYAGLLTAVTDAEAGTVTETTYGGYARQADHVRRSGRESRWTSDSRERHHLPGEVGRWRCYDHRGRYLRRGKRGQSARRYHAVRRFTARRYGQRFSDVAGNTIQSPAHGLTTNDTVRIEQFPGDTPLPAGLSENTTYFVIATGLLRTSSSFPRHKVAPLSTSLRPGGCS